MKTFRYFVLALLLGGFVCVRYQARSLGALFSSSTEFKVVTNITRTATLPAGLKRLEVENHSGTVHIVGSDAAPYDWTWTLTVRARTDAFVREAAAKAICKQESAGDRVRLLVSLPDTGGKVSLQSDLEIRVPKSVSVETKNGYGRTEISDLTGDAEVSGQSGSIRLQRVGGKVRAHTSYGALTVRDSGPATLKNQSGQIEASGIHGALVAETAYGSLTAADIEGNVRLLNQSGRIHLTGVKGDADIKTSYGEIVARDITGRASFDNQSGRITASGISGSVRAFSSYGEIDLECGGPDIRCENKSGSLHLHATSTALSNLVARTSYGSMEVRLPDGLKPALQAHTTYGHLKSDFPVLSKERGGNPFTDVPTGIPRVILENQSGNLRVVRE